MQSNKEDATIVQTGKERDCCYLSNFFEGARNAFKADELGCEIAVIALPALVALAADPLASLVDTAFIGRLGSVELAAVGVSIAVFNLISKLLNFPVLNLTTSLVAEESIDARGVCEIEMEKRTSEATTIDARGVGEIEMEKGLSDSIPKENDAFISVKVSEEKGEENRLAFQEQTSCKKEPQRNLPAISTALIVGFVLGVFELIVLVTGYGPILSMMGIPVGSNMRLPAEQYLRLRAISCPAVVISLAAQGVFRGFKDTRTPLFATATGNVVNMVLVPILMFNLGYGVRGSAIATVISQYLIAFILLLKLSNEVSLLPPKLDELKFGHFLKNGGLLLARSAAVMLSMTLATSLAARLGAVPMAAHQICMQVWLATSLLSDAMAVAAQTIIATALAKQDYKLAKIAAFRILQIGFVFGIILSLILGVGLGTFSKLFTTDKRVLRFLALGTPFVATTQPINSIAFIFDGLHFGSSDFKYAAYSMIIVAIMSSGIMFLSERMWRFIGIWVGLTVLMTMRMFTGFLRVGTASGPWKFLR